MWSVARTPAGFQLVDITTQTAAGRKTTFAGNFDPSLRQEAAAIIETRWNGVAFHVEGTPIEVPKAGSQLLAGILGATYGHGKTKACMVGACGANGHTQPVPLDDLPAILRAIPDDLIPCLHYDSAMQAVKMGRLSCYLNGGATLQSFAHDPEEWYLRQINWLHPDPGWGPPEEKPQPKPPDLSVVVGQHLAIESLIVALAGRHHALLIGPPGEGKSLMAEAAQGVLPPLSDDEWKEVTEIADVARIPAPSNARPFRSVGPGTLASAILGGGSERVEVGLVSLAHRGILHIDEFLQFSPALIEKMRTVLQTKRSVISRTGFKLELPADFQLLASANPCPCTWLGHPTRPCTCTPAQLQRYRSRLSGALLDRIDLRIPVPVVDPELYLTDRPSVTSADAQARVVKAWAQQEARYGRGTWNSTAPTDVVRALPMSQGARRWLLASEADSLREFSRTIRLAQTLCDLERAERIELLHMERAVGLSKADPWKAGETT